MARVRNARSDVAHWYPRLLYTMRRAVSKTSVHTFPVTGGLTGHSEQGESGRKAASGEAVRSKGAGSIKWVGIYQKGEHSRKNQNDSSEGIASASYLKA